MGHALLLRAGDLAGLRAAFARNILPLLQEYFFGDWGKIGLVLGSAFMEVVAPGAPGRHALARFGSYEGGSGRDKPLYRLRDVENLSAAAFRSLYDPTAA